MLSLRTNKVLLLYFKLKLKDMKKVLICLLLLASNLVNAQSSYNFDTRVETLIINDKIISSDTVSDFITVQEEEKFYSITSVQNGLYGVFYKNENQEKDWVLIRNKLPLYDEYFSFKTIQLYVYMKQYRRENVVKITQFFNLSQITNR